MVEDIFSRMSPELREQWGAWLLVKEGLCTISELNSTLTSEDVQMGLAFLTARSDLEKHQYEKDSPKSGN